MSASVNSLMRVKTVFVSNDSSFAHCTSVNQSGLIAQTKLMQRSEHKCSDSSSYSRLSSCTCRGSGSWLNGDSFNYTMHDKLERSDAYDYDVRSSNYAIRHCCIDLYHVPSCNSKYTDRVQKCPVSMAEISESPTNRHKPKLFETHCDVLYYHQGGCNPIALNETTKIPEVLPKHVYSCSCCRWHVYNLGSSDSKALSPELKDPFETEWSVFNGCCYSVTCPCSVGSFVLHDCCYCNTLALHHVHYDIVHSNFSQYHGSRRAHLDSELRPVGHTLSHINRSFCSCHYLLERGTCEYEEGVSQTNMVTHERNLSVALQVVFYALGPLGVQAMAFQPESRFGKNVNEPRA